MSPKSLSACLGQQTVPAPSLSVSLKAIREGFAQSLDDLDALPLDCAKSTAQSIISITLTWGGVAPTQSSPN